VVGEFHWLTRFVLDHMWEHEFKIEFESLSGKKYRTSVIWEEGEMKTTFSGSI
jgi:hypothetical protein